MWVGAGPRQRLGVGVRHVLQRPGRRDHGLAPARCSRRRRGRRARVRPSRRTRRRCCATSRSRADMVGMRCGSGLRILSCAAGGAPFDKLRVTRGSPNSFAPGIALQTTFSGRYPGHMAGSVSRRPRGRPGPGAWLLDALDAWWRPAAFLAAMVLVWWLVTAAGLVKPYLIPSPGVGHRRVSATTPGCSRGTPRSRCSRRSSASSSPRPSAWPARSRSCTRAASSGRSTRCCSSRRSCRRSRSRRCSWCGSASGSRRRSSSRC